MACAVWEFRCNQDYFTLDDLKTFLSFNCKRYCFQLEQGDSGYIHWQGRLSLIKKRTKDALMKLITEQRYKVFNYLEPTTNKEHQKTAFYSMKIDTRLEGPYMDTDPKPENVYIPIQYRDIKLYPWQQQILDDAKKKDFRTINMIYDKRGNRGKSTLASIAELLHNAIDMPPLNDFKELIALLCNICMDKELRNPSLVFIDMPRAMRKDQLFGMYSAIEQIKKGKLYDIRYHYKQWWIDSPSVWVFSNIEPDMELLSADRWKIWNITDDHKLIPYKKPEYNLDD